MSDAPKVTIEDLEAEIASERYFTAAEGVEGAYHKRGGVHPVGRTPSQEEHARLGLLTICVLVLKNGFTVLGEAYCRRAEDFDEATGREAARQAAVARMWPLLAYRLADREQGGGN